MRQARRWLARAGAALATIIIAVTTAIYAISEYRFRRHYEIAAHWPAHAGGGASSSSTPLDTAAINDGRRLAAIHGCTDCHGQNLAGRMFVDDPLIGHIATANLTRGRGGRASYAPADWERAIRHGVSADGRPLLVMPANEFNHLSDQDIADLVAFVLSVPPVDHELPRPTVGPLGRLLFVAGAIPAVPAEQIDQLARHIDRVTPAPTAEYGGYLAPGCTGCHGTGFSGGKIPGSPPNARPAGNLTPDSATGIGSWSEEDFVWALRRGVRPDGSSIDSTAMPIAFTRQMTDTELRALYKYLRTRPPRARGQR
jgi:mono/diheme cytochrome c family protein